MTCHRLPTRRQQYKLCEDASHGDGANEWLQVEHRCASSWFMALRLADASSSLWPPDRKLMPAASRHAAAFSVTLLSRGHVVVSRIEARLPASTAQSGTGDQVRTKCCYPSPTRVHRGFCSSETADIMSGLSNVGKTPRVINHLHQGWTAVLQTHLRMVQLVGGARSFSIRRRAWYGRRNGPPQRAHSGSCDVLG